MAALIASICCTLVILAFCQIIVETILPQGNTKRYVVFITGLVAVVVIVTTFTVSGSEFLKSIYAKTAEIQKIADSQSTPETGNTQSNPYKDYIEKLIDTYK
jgi:hypothetical protein